MPIGRRSYQIINELKIWASASLASPVLPPPPPPPASSPATSAAVAAAASGGNEPGVRGDGSAVAAARSLSAVRAMAEVRRLTAAAMCNMAALGGARSGDMIQDGGLQSLLALALVP